MDILGQAIAIVIVGLFIGYIIWGRSDQGRESLMRMGMITTPKKRTRLVKKTPTSQMTPVKKSGGSRKRTTVR